MIKFRQRAGTSCTISDNSAARATRVNRNLKTVVFGTPNIMRRPRLAQFMLMAAALLASTPSLEAKELVGNVSDDLSQEMGFPLYSQGPQNLDPKAVVVAIHGATLHARSFTNLSKELSQRGYMVIAGDMRGFGAWYHGPPRGENSKHVLYKWSEADLRRLLSKIREIYPEKPIFLMGESVGANMAVRLLAGDPYCAEGAILSSPAVKQRLFFGPTVVKQVLTVMVKPSAQLSVEPFIKSRISESEQITQERINDPLARNHLNVGELFKTRWFNKESLERAPLFPRKAPVLVLEGTEDKLFDAKDVHQLMADLPSQDKELLWLEGKGHINLETKYLDPFVVNLIGGWLDKKTSAVLSVLSNGDGPALQAKVPLNTHSD